MSVAAAAVGLVVALSGCATDSPAGHLERESKAAAVPLFRLQMTKDLWERTSSADSHGEIEKPKKLTETPEGLATVELTGPQMVDYLQILDYNAHGGMFARDESLAVAVYTAAAGVIDRIEVPPPADAPVPEIVVDAAVAPVKDAAPR